MRSLSGLQVYFLRLCGSTIGYLLILFILSLKNFSLDILSFNYVQIAGVIIFGALSYCCYYQAIYLLKPIKAMALNITYSVWAIGLGYLIYQQPIKPITLLLTLLLSAGVIVTLYYKGNKMNAIILAAGLGSRFKDITQSTHKSLLDIHGTPNLERTLTFLRQANIDNIVIVTGYLHEQFEYLKKKYDCTFDLQTKNIANITAFIPFLWHKTSLMIVMLLMRM